MQDTAILDTKKVVTPQRRLGRVVGAVAHAIGTGFTAKHFSEEMFNGTMDPLLMVDHFVMTAPTFPPHLHAGISAVTMMFEDAEGLFLNRDTLGHDIGLKAGDMYWLAAASGAVHEERPEDGGRTHALQIFVNLPAQQKSDPARSLHVFAQDVHAIKQPGCRVRVILGESNGIIGAREAPQPMTMLDGFLGANSCFIHALPANLQAFIYAVSGELTVQVGGETRIVPAEHATTISMGESDDVRISAESDAHFVLMAGAPIRETFAKAGPLVMSTTADVQRTLQNYAQGEFGRIEDREYPAPQRAVVPEQADDEDDGDRRRFTCIGRAVSARSA